MRIVNELPPNYAKLCEAFPAIVNEPDVIFAWGDKIYNPGGREIPPYKIAHEKVHSKQQLDIGDIEWWWNMYIEMKSFRYQEEVPAHQADYRAFCRQYKDKNEQARYLDHLAGLLSGELYGNIVSKVEAMRVIKHG